MTRADLNASTPPFVFVGALCPRIVMDPDELGRARRPSEDDVVGKEEGERLPFEVRPRLPHRVARTQGLALLDERELRQPLGRQRPLGQGGVAPFPRDRLDP